jgi:hypothetical protein
MIVMTMITDDADVAISFRDLLDSFIGLLKDYTKEVSCRT